MSTAEESGTPAAEPSSFKPSTTQLRVGDRVEVIRGDVNKGRRGTVAWINSDTQKAVRVVLDGSNGVTTSFARASLKKVELLPPYVTGDTVYFIDVAGRPHAGKRGIVADVKVDTSQSGYPKTVYDIAVEGYGICHVLADRAEDVITRRTPRQAAEPAVSHDPVVTGYFMSLVENDGTITNAWGPTLEAARDFVSTAPPGARSIFEVMSDGTIGKEVPAVEPKYRRFIVTLPDDGRFEPMTETNFGRKYGLDSDGLIVEGDDY